MGERRVGLRTARRRADGRQAPCVRDELLGRRVRLQGGRAAAAASRGRDRQHRQRAVGVRRAAAGIDSASKHAVKGYTDALRMELETVRAPISVMLIKPGPIDTPYPQHARNDMAEEPKHRPPVYPPEEVA